MKMQGIAARFDCAHGEQYDHIVAFWEQMRALCPEQVLFGVGYGWENDSLGYLIGTPEGVPEYALEGVRKILPQAAFSEITLPDDNWKTYTGTADTLDKLYEEIYRDGPLDFEIEQFDDAGNAVIQIHRAEWGRQDYGVYGDRPGAQEHPEIRHAGGRA